MRQTERIRALDATSERATFREWGMLSSAREPSLALGGALIPSKTSLVPAPPFAEWPVQMTFGDDDALIWYVPGGTICVQLHTGRCDLAAAKQYVAAIRTIRAIKSDEIGEAGGLRIYQDCRSVQVFDRPARMYITEAAQQDFGPHDLVVNKISLSVHNALVRVAVQLTAMAARTLQLPTFDLEADLAAELRDADVRPPFGPDADALVEEYWRRMRRVAACA